MFRDQNAGRGHTVKIDNSFFERVEGFKYLGTTLTDQNSIQEELKDRLKLGNACYYSCRICVPCRRCPAHIKTFVIRRVVYVYVKFTCKSHPRTG